MKWTEGNGYEQAPSGNHLARCVGLIDLGTQESTFQGERTEARKVVLRFELPEQLMQQGKFVGQPFVVSRFYTASLHKSANLRQDLEGWLGRKLAPGELKGFSPKDFILDRTCLLNVTHSESGKAKVAGITPVPQGTPIPKRVNRLVYLSLEKDHFDVNEFAALSEFWKDLIMKSPEYQRVS